MLSSKAPVMAKSKIPNRPTPTESQLRKIGLHGKFSYPQKAQGASRLLILPAELRIKVLRNLLKADKASVSIKRFYNTGNQDESRPNQLGFSSQLLACCQQLYFEGHDILYKENTLRIRVFDNTLYIMGLRQKLYYSTAGLIHTGDDLLTEILKFSSSNSNNTHPMLKAYAALSQFYNISFQIHAEKPENLYVACQLLRNVLNGKSVSMSVACGRLPVTPAPAIWLSACRMLRCNSIAFPKQEDARTKATRKLIESNQKVTDMCDIMTTRADAIARFWSIKPQTAGLKPTMDRYGKLLKSAIVAHSVKRVAKYRPLFAHATEDVMNDYIGARTRSDGSKSNSLKETERWMLEVVNRLRV